MKKKDFAKGVIWTLSIIVIFFYGCSTSPHIEFHIEFKDDEIIIYEGAEHDISENIYIAEMKAKRPTKNTKPKNLKSTKLRFKQIASKHCMKFRRTAVIKSIEPRYEINGKIFGKYHEVYYCK